MSNIKPLCRSFGISPGQENICLHMTIQSVTVEPVVIYSQKSEHMIPLSRAHQYNLYYPRIVGRGSWPDVSSVLVWIWFVYPQDLGWEAWSLGWYSGKVVEFLGSRASWEFLRSLEEHSQVGWWTLVNSSGSESSYTPAPPSWCVGCLSRTDLMQVAELKCKLNYPVIFMS